MKCETGNTSSRPSPSESDLPSSGNRESRVVTREELAEILKVSVRTVDAMAANGEIPHMRLRGNLVRFYLPDVVRSLTANALISKRGCAHRLASESRAEVGA
jgi:excisionase family DNA binding protein